MEAVIFTGIQASGKSSFYKAQFFDTHIRINLDMLKTRNREDILLNACLRMKQRFVVDNTNPTAADRIKYIQAARLARFEIVGYFFAADPQDAILRNGERLGKARVPSLAITITHRKLQPPTYEEGFNRLYSVRAVEGGGFDVQEWPRPLT
ncbi:MAG TPA: ATP-binding protein [Chloroflexia bacterium]|nr:ATP-binding protein [Chloroflexia bacterium]